ncbi:MAG: YaiI/YqxD family protein [Desulfitobacteriaceae bacterium]
MKKIIIDADACPRSVLQICLKLGRDYNLPVWTVASFNHNIESDYHIVVGNASQEADLKVMNLTIAGDIAVTQDWGLAAMLLGKRVRCLSPSGKEFCSDTIEFLMEEREVKARLRRGGTRTKGPKKRTIKDDKRFEVCLHEIIRQEGISNA